MRTEIAKGKPINNTVATLSHLLLVMGRFTRADAWKTFNKKVSWKNSEKYFLIRAELDILVGKDTSDYQGGGTDDATRLWRQYEGALEKAQTLMSKFDTEVRFLINYRSETHQSLAKISELRNKLADMDTKLRELELAEPSIEQRLLAEENYINASRRHGRVRQAYLSERKDFVDHQPDVSAEFASPYEYFDTKYPVAARFQAVCKEYDAAREKFVAANAAGCMRTEISGTKKTISLLEEQTSQDKQAKELKEIENKINLAADDYNTARAELELAEIQRDKAIIRREKRLKKYSLFQNLDCKMHSEYDWALDEFEALEPRVNPDGAIYKLLTAFVVMKRLRTALTERNQRPAF